jgi:hypothetical protein
MFDKVLPLSRCYCNQYMSVLVIIISYITGHSEVYRKHVQYILIKYILGKTLKCLTFEKLIGTTFWYIEGEIFNKLLNFKIL